MLVDFGAFNLRLASTLHRRLKYGRPVIDVFPPGTWLDNEQKAREVATVSVPLTAFAHQYDFYKSHRLPIVYFGHPLAGEYHRGRRAGAAGRRRHGRDSAGKPQGRTALHLPALIAAFAMLQAQRPRPARVFGAADARGERFIRRVVKRERLADAEVVRGVAGGRRRCGRRVGRVRDGRAGNGALRRAGGRALHHYAHPGQARTQFDPASNTSRCRTWCSAARSFPSCFKKKPRRNGSPSEMETVLRDPAQQYDQFAELRAALGPPDALSAARGSRSRSPRPARRDPHLPHLGSARPPRLRRRACARLRAERPGCSSIAATRCAAAKRCTIAPNRSSASSTPPVTTRRAIGNREFHYLFPLLRARAARMHHPLVCTNLLDTKGRALPFVPSLIVRTRGRAHPRARAAGHAVSDGQSVGARLRLAFLDPWDAVEPYARDVPAGDMLVVLSHVGLSLDRKLAQRVPRIDLLLGGHSHDTLFEPEYVGGVPIVHAGPYGRYVSRTELDYDDARRALRDPRLRARSADSRARDAVALRHQRARRSGDRRSHRARPSRARSAMRRSTTSRSSAKGASRTCVERRAAARDAQRRPDRDGQRAQHRARRRRGIARAHGGAVSLRRAARAGDTTPSSRSATSYALLMSLAARRARRVRRHGEERQRRAVRTVRGARAAPRARRVRARRCDRRAAATNAGWTCEPAANVIVDLFAGRRATRARGRWVRAGDRAASGQPRERVRRRAFLDRRSCANSSPTNAGARRGALGRAGPGRRARFAADARADGWEVASSDDAEMPFVLRRNGRVLVRAWRGPLGAVLARATLVMGQAGTANEAAAAAGVPVVAFERGRDRKTTWYRQRQRGLLGEALAVFPGDERRRRGRARRCSTTARAARAWARSDERGWARPAARAELRSASSPSRAESERERSLRRVLIAAIAFTVVSSRSFRRSSR